MFIFGHISHLSALADSGGRLRRFHRQSTVGHRQFPSALCRFNRLLAIGDWLFPAGSRPAFAILLFAGVFAGVLAGVGCSRKEPGNEASGPPEVLTTPVVQQDVPVMQEWVGVLDGSVDAVIHARVSGYIVTRNYEEGALVKEGDLLFQIDPRPFEAALAQAKADLAKAQANQLKTGIDVKRLGILYKQGAASEEDYDTATQADAAAQADAEARKAAVQTAELNLEYARITAPVTGIAGQANANIGDLVGPGTDSLTTISVVDPIKAYISFSEPEYLTAAPRFKELEATPAEKREPYEELILSTGETHPYKGKFDFADRQVDPRTGTIRIAILFPNPGNLLRPGQFARVRAPVAIVHGALLVPQRAVKELQGGAQVAVIGPDNKASIRSVTAGERYGSMWVISEGLKPGERVVVEGLQKVRDGVLVSPKPWTPPASAPATRRADQATSSTEAGL
ncbi:MAG: efflux RND transporter periplasmic adaptor subunit [Candidatus Sumerlaeota bacterium]|nr:efflux RND transporter periplasmic adaptor subunit [Candidatus Sumerlaeota bacterium]